MIHPVSHVAIVANTYAGKGRALKVVDQLVELLSAKSISFDIYIEAWPEDFTEHSDVFLVGGDGTLNHFINRYPDFNKPMTLFKGGSGNDFAWKLYRELTNEEIFQKALHTECRPVDAGICNGRYFLNGVGIGFDGNIVKAMKGKKLISAGHIAYMFAVVRSVLFYLEKRAAIFFNEESIEERFFMITVANGERYGGGFRVAPGASINDQLLDIVTIGRIDPIRRMYHLPKVASGRHLLLPFVKRYRSGEVIVQSKTPLTAHIDGEPSEENEFRIRVLPGHFQFRY